MFDSIQYTMTTTKMSNSMLSSRIWFFSWACWKWNFLKSHEHEQPNKRKNSGEKPITPMRRTKKGMKNYAKHFGPELLHFVWGHIGVLFKWEHFIQMRMAHPLSVAHHFWWKEEARRKHSFCMDNSQLQFSCLWKDVWRDCTQF